MSVPADTPDIVIEPVSLVPPVYMQGCPVMVLYAEVAVHPGTSDEDDADAIFEFELLDTYKLEEFGEVMVA